jgi:hypothetical protein
VFITRSIDMAKAVCIIMGLAFIAIAIWGFIAKDAVLIFHVNTAHNIVHLASGILALLCGLAGEGPAKRFSIIFGLVYGLVAAMGFLNVQFVNDLLHLNNADDWLHLAIAAIFLFAGVASRPIAKMSTAR